MPPEIVARLNRELNELLKSSPELRQRLQSAGGLDLIGGSTAAFRDMLHKEVALWRDIARNANVTAPQ
jgi:tripartite-type tricarboxylate transporter receptor subunit TctC